MTNIDCLFNLASVQISVWTTNATGSFKGISALKNVFGIPKSVFWTKVIQGILLI
jgi:hypothetical protein